MRNKAVALALSSHPGPTLAVSAITLLLGADAGLGPGRLMLLGSAVLLGQVSVGLSNDWLDADRDRAAGRGDKPVAAGLVTAAMARAAAFVAAALAIALTVPLGPGATLAHAVFIASAWTYNLGLKNTMASVLPYIVSFGILPLIVTLARSVPAFAAPWAIALGALLGVAAHFANVLPDLEDDRRTGIRGLPHRLGRRTSGVFYFLVLAVAAVVALAGPAGAPSLLRWAGFALTLAIAAGGMILAVTRKPGRLLFRLIIAAALVVVAMLVLSGQRLPV